MCDLCKSKADEYRVQDDDDRRSIASMPSPSYRPHMSVDVSEKGMSPYGIAKSPFAASQLFAPNTNLHEALSAIEEGAGSPWPEDGDGGPFIPRLPDGGVSDDEDENSDTAAPFRRQLDDDGRFVPSITDVEAMDDSGARKVSSPVTPGILPDTPPRPEFRNRLNSRIARFFPRTETMSTDGADSRLALSRMDSNVPFYGLRTRLSSRASHGALLGLHADLTHSLFRQRTNSFR